MTPISFFVPGNPKGLKRHRSTKTGIHYDPSAGDKKDFLGKAMANRPDEPILGPVCLQLTCVFARPKCHYRTGRNAHLLKETAPYWYTSTPDADNVLKFVGDALNGIFWKDDRQVIPLPVYRVYGKTPGIQIHLREPTPFDVQSAMLSLEP